MSGEIHTCAEQSSACISISTGRYREMSIYLTSEKPWNAADAGVSVYGIRYCPWCGKDLSEEEDR